MFVERMTGFEPATSTLARHKQLSNPYEHNPYEHVRFRAAQSVEYGPVRAVDGMQRTDPHAKLGAVTSPLGGSTRRGECNP